MFIACAAQSRYAEQSPLLLRHLILEAGLRGVSPKSDWFEESARDQKWSRVIVAARRCAASFLLCELFFCGSSLRELVDAIRDFLRSVDFENCQPARLARRLDRKVAHSENSLAEPLMYGEILNSRDQDGPNGFAQKAYFVPQSVIQDRYLGQAVSEMAFQRPEQKERGQRGKPGLSWLRNPRRPVHTERRDHRRRYDQKHESVADVYEFHRRTNDRFGHLLLL